jgi:hypothetical protein
MRWFYQRVYLIVLGKLLFEVKVVLGGLEAGTS